MMCNQDGVWLRGNLHMHTRRSDGQMPYEEAIALYEQAGYDFVAVTDHWVVSQKGMTPGGMLLLSGCEYDVGKKPSEGIYHILAVNMAHDPGLLRGDESLTAQRIIDTIHEEGGMAVLAHPAWSLNCAQDAASLHGFDGVEIFNTTSGYPLNLRPYSGLFVDQMAVRGILLPCIAADDTHQYTQDLFGGYLMVHAKEKTHEALMEALRSGSFYATQGPKLSVNREGNLLKIRCSPAERIAVYSGDLFNAHRVFTQKGITEATYVITHQDEYLRVEVEDQDGKRAYSSPVRV